VNVNLSTVLAIVFAIMLAVLGHGVWHGPMISIFGFIVGLFTGGHVTG
jgi:hypothetical protein